MFSAIAVQRSSCCMARVLAGICRGEGGSEAKWPLCSEISNTAFHICTKNLGVVPIFQFYV